MRYVSLENLTEGMILGKSLFNQQGMLLLQEGKELSSGLIKKLNEVHYSGLYIHDEFSEGIEIKDVISDEIRRNASMAVGRLLTNLEADEVPALSQDMTQITDMLHQIIDEIMSSSSTIVNIIDLKEFDAYTHQHSVSVCVLSCIIGVVLGFSKKELYDLALSGILHDIGKIFIEKDILNKPGKFEPEEYEIIKTHSQLGFELIHNKCRFSHKVGKAILHHHERFDGGGYPLKKKGKDIMIYSQIIAVADVYDALTSKRPYRDPILPSEAYEYVMGNSGQAFNPEIVNVFIKKIAPYPVGVQVELSNGLTGIVFHNHENAMMRPLIKLIPLPGQAKENYLDLNKADFHNITIQKVLI